MGRGPAIVAGDAVVDLIVPLPRFLDREQTEVKFGVPAMQGGGTAANTAVALARLGVPTSFVGTVGDDQYGRYVAADFEREGVGVELLLSDPGLCTICVFAFVDERGERYLWGWPREKQAFKEIDLGRVDLGAVRRASWVHSSGMALVHDSSARSGVLRILREAKEAGVPTSFDLNLRTKSGRMDEGFRQAVREAIAYSDYVLGSKADEFPLLSERGDWRDAAESLVTGTRTVIARSGGDAAVAMTPDGFVEARPIPVEVVDTVGAGDVFDAGFISARLEGMPLLECLERGNAAAAYKVSRKGARSSPSAAELELFRKSASA